MFRRSSRWTSKAATQERRPADDTSSRGEVEGGLHEDHQVDTARELLGAHDREVHLVVEEHQVD